MPRTPTRSSRVRRRILLAVAAVLLLVVLGFVTYASFPFPAEAAPLAAAERDPAITVTEVSDGIVLTPTTTGTASTPSTGLVFIAGARVDPAAYVSTLSGIAANGTTVVIVQPILNFAILDWRPLSTFTRMAPGVSRWFVGGHSLGGVRACQYAADDPEVVGLVFFGSYCAADISAGDTRVLSIGGSRDGLSTPAKIRDAAHLLPADATFVEIAGANHASFGDYGRQPGDGTATAGDADVRRQITTTVDAFLAE
ncbi:alpha/beta hydrolase [Glaciihabitans sp. dw_435]|uniref:alpha/beta hydrolase n=1 Tax=Glaciihabitans sp. dw_435 TaxID=2720081 RepID=UPI001BD2E90A|nr:alpha/beta hydrolase [Glaciihabitans sp. dw_435]